MQSLENIEFVTKKIENDFVINVNGVSKKFCRSLKKSLFYGLIDICTELTGIERKSYQLRKGEFWALKNVDLQLKKGESIGLVGANGAGKSTLLRIISGLIKPDTGNVKVRGKLAPLIALGAGFNPILTGRENVYANMAILGLSSSEITERFEDVIQFAEIDEAIDAPVQTYSSGMAARLGFACAVYIEPDILLIDEVLAVGDIKFRMKCYQRLEKMRENGTAFILVAHNPHVILNVCDRAVYLNKGNFICEGRTEDILNQYEQDLFVNGLEKDDSECFVSFAKKKTEESYGLDIISLSFNDNKGKQIKNLVSGQSAYLCIKCYAHRTIENANVGILISADSGSYGRVLYISSASDNQIIEFSPGEAEIQMQMPYCGLLPGLYSAKIYIKQGICSLDVVESFKFLVKTDKIMSQCLFYQPRNWKIIEIGK
ncbi:MAG: ABC transporter ATP-binding protein [Mastigocoleus sp.]